MDRPLVKRMFKKYFVLRAVLDNSVHTNCAFSAELRFDKKYLGGPDQHGLLWLYNVTYVMLSEVQYRLTTHLNLFVRN